MYSTARPFYITVRTPLHAGSGSDLGVVDLPIQRERHTGHPKIEGSSLKGAVRERYRRLSLSEESRVTPNQLEALFGPDSGEEDLHAGALGLTDARVLLFPVKSLKGVFAWATCPGVLRRWKSELESAGVEADWSVPDPNVIPEGSELGVAREDDAEKIVLEEYTFEVRPDAAASALASAIQSHLGDLGGLSDRLVVLPDDAFRDFTEMSTEVITRTKIDPDTGTVAQGQLFTEEYLPAESVLYFLTLHSPLQNGQHQVFEDESAFDFFRDTLPDTLQIGGNATTGKGLVRVHTQ